MFAGEIRCLQENDAVRTHNKPALENAGLFRSLKINRASSSLNCDDYAADARRSRSAGNRFCATAKLPNNMTENSMSATNEVLKNGSALV